MSSRILELNALLAEDPADPFLKYALALELEKEGKTKEAGEQLLFLISETAEYLPAYYQAGRLLLLQGRMQDAVEVLRKGVLLAERQKNRHTLSELNFLLSEIVDADE